MVYWCCDLLVVYCLLCDSVGCCGVLAGSCSVLVVSYFVAPVLFLFYVGVDYICLLLLFWYFLFTGLGVLFGVFDCDFLVVFACSIGYDWFYLMCAVAYWIYLLLQFLFVLGVWWVVSVTFEVVFVWMFGWLVTLAGFCCLILCLFCEWSVC